MERNAVINSDPDNFSSNKDNYLFNNCSFLSNYNHHRDHLDNGSNSESDINTTVQIKNTYGNNKIKHLL